MVPEKDGRRKISDMDLELAKGLYMDFVPISEIAKKINCNRLTLQNYVNNSWRQEREIFSKELLFEIANNKKAQLTKISGLTADILIRSLQELTSRTAPLTIQEAKDAASLYEKLDKILKLDEGQPTDIMVSEKPATIIEIKDRIANADPFYQAELVEFKEEENNEDTININRIRNDDEPESSEGSDKD